MYRIRSVEEHKENNLLLVILERQEQVCDAVVEDPFFLLYHFSFPLLHHYLVPAQPLLSSLPAGNLIKVTSRFLPHSPYTYNCHCLLHSYCLSVFPLTLFVRILNLPASFNFSSSDTPLKLKEKALAFLLPSIHLWVSHALNLSVFKQECVSCLGLPAPWGIVSRVHLFEGFLIRGLGQPQSTMPSSIIPAEEWRGGEGVERRRKNSRGDGMISYLSSLSPTRSTNNYYHPLHLSHLSHSFCVSIFPHCLSIYLLVWLSLLPCIWRTCVQRQPSLCPSLRILVCLVVWPQPWRWSLLCLRTNEDDLLL